MTEMIHLDEAVASEVNFRPFLANDGKPLAIGVSSSCLGAGLTVPYGKAVYILDGAALTLGANNLAVDGIVYVGSGAGLSAASTGKVKVPKAGGHVYVVKGGTLSVKDKLSVSDGATAEATLLGTAKAGFTAASMLTLGSTAAVADIKNILGLLSVGIVNADASTAVVALLPAADFKTLVSASKRLLITANGTETGPALSVPAGLALTTGETLGTVTTLTLNGTLTAASGTFAGLATVTGTGFLTAGAVGVAKAPLIIESALIGASLASTAITDDNLVIPADAVRILTGAAAPSGNVTVNGELEVSGAGSLTVATGKNLVVAPAGTLSVGNGTNDVIFKKATIVSVSTGVVLAGSIWTAPFLATDYLILAEGGSLTTKGTGKATFGTTLTTFDGAGS
ncbi:MAG: hypothetical protein LBG27_00905 [Spirochaetaceae bacterium]|nr:hypothetical protein [Spirochaetaceae bacterium]